MPKPPPPPVDVPAHLDRAAKAIAAREPATALPDLLAAWRAHSSERIAALVETTSDLAEAANPTVPGATMKQRLAAAKQLFAAGDPVDVPRVLRTLSDITLGDAKTFAAELADLPRDPRYLRALGGLLAAPPWVSSTAGPLWRTLFDQLVAHADPRASARLAAVDLAAAFTTAWSIEQMQGAVRRIAKKLVAVEPPADAAIAAACTRVERALAAGTDRGRTLLAAIHQEPGDLKSRAIYGDHLQEAGDPRGELIALQLVADPTDEQRKRARALFDERGDTWLGALAPAIREVRRFERGFLAAARVDVPRALALRDAIEWSTVEELWLRDAGDAIPWELLRAPAMRALRFVGGIEEVHLAELAREPWPFAGLGIALPDYTDKLTAPQRKRLAALDLPSVRDLALYSAAPELVRALWASPTFARLARLRTQSGIASVVAWSRETVPAHVAAIEISFDHGWHGWTIELARGADAKLSRMTAVLRPSRREFTTSKVTDLVEHVFDELAPDALESFRLIVDGAAASKADLATVAEAAARQTRLGIAARASKAPKVKEQRAAAAAAAGESARAAYDRAVDALPGVTLREAFHAFDYGDPASVRVVVAALDNAARPLAAAWIDVCYALIALPVEKGQDRNAVHLAAIRILVELKPEGAGARVTALVEQGGSRALENDFTMIPTAELPVLFDWFERRHGATRPPPAHQIYYAVRAAAVANGTAATRAELQRRTKKKLGRFVGWAYEHAIKELRGRK